MVMRPTALPVHVVGIHEALRRERRWDNWRNVWQQHEGKAGRWTKVPYQPSGQSAKSNDPSTWHSLAEALAAYHAGGFDGVVYALGDGWAGVDVDDYVGHECRLIEQIAGRRERSPGKLGIKIIGRADRIGGQIDFAVYPPAFTTWWSARFFAITGQDACGDPLADLSAFIDTWFPTPTPVVSGTREGYTLAAESTDDDLLISMMANDANGDAILALWRGDTSAYGNDHSRADLALVCHLAFWCNYDAERVDRLFRQSGLMRDKWDAPSYQRSTLQKALR